MNVFPKIAHSLFASLLLSTAVPACAADFEVWNAGPLDHTATTKYEGMPPTPKPLRIVVPRNGIGSGQVVAVRSDGLDGLNANLSALLSESGQKLPVGATTVQFAAGASDTDAPRWKEIPYLPILHAKAPKASVVPVWVTVTLPADVAAGVYTGKITLKFGDETRSVPVEVRVAPWAVPAPRNLATRFDIYQSPEAVANFYGVEMWSEPHWKLVERSLALCGQYGSKVLWVPIVSGGTVGHTRSVVQVARKGNGWVIDTSHLDRYLELFDKHCGPPLSVNLHVWSGLSGIDVHNRRGTEEDLPNVKPFRVAGIDGKSVELKNFTPEAAAFWKEMLAACRASAVRRKWSAECVMLGTAMDIHPSKFFVDQMKEAAPEMTWVSHAHDQKRDFYGVKVGYCANARSQPDWDGPGWANPRLNVWFPYDESPCRGSLMRLRAAPELAVQNKHRGQGRILADFWSKPGTPEMDLWVGGQPTMRMYGPQIFAPGPDGAQHTVPSLVLLESVQETEARTAVEKALAVRKNIPEDLVARARKLLADRAERTNAVLSRVDRRDFSEQFKAFDAARVQDRAFELYEIAAMLTDPSQEVKP